MAEQRFEVGGLWDLPSWELVTDELVDGLNDGKPPCPHAKDHTVTVITSSYNGYSYEKHRWTVPRVIIAGNEGGSCSTGLCLDCVLEATRA